MEPLLQIFKLTFRQIDKADFKEDVAAAWWIGINDTLIPGTVKLICRWAMNDQLIPR